MRSKLSILTVFLLLALLASSVLAQESEETIPLSEQFPSLRIKDQFIQPATVKYYRFAKDTLFFEPIDLSYFPHESWEEDDWALLARWKDGKTSKQQIYLDTPTQNELMHGIDLGQSSGFLRDFYMYADLFVLDNYPENSGSCYLYYSNSLLEGFADSTGILIDPREGIFKVKNSYGKYYSQYNLNHDFDKLFKLDPAEFQINENDIPASSIAGASFSQANFDDQFAQDWDFLKSEYRMPQSSAVLPYRIEIIRVNGVADIYINGKQVASFEDGLLNKDLNPDKVSWSYGPRLQKGGLTVTCAIGDLFIYGTGQRED